MAFCSNFSFSSYQFQSKMQASTSVKGGVVSEVRSRRVFSGNRPIRIGTSSGVSNLSFVDCNRKSNLTSMGGRFARTAGVDGLFRSSAKQRSVRVQASGGDLEEAAPLKFQGKSSASVLPYVGVACLGAILFGYHLGVVNGALEYLSPDLGISGNTVLQGWVVSTLLAGATLGSFTGGSLADKFGRTRTFQLDAIPLAVGAYLCATAQSVETMMIGRVLSGIGIGISSALVPLYISEISPTEIRGALGSVNQLFICIGILAALIAGLPLSGNPLWYNGNFKYIKGLL